MNKPIDPSTIGQPEPRKERRRHQRTATGYLPEKDEGGKEIWPRGDEAAWKSGLRGVDTDLGAITKSIVGHVQTTIARRAYNIDEEGMYRAISYSVRDDLIVNWNDTQMLYTKKSPKRAYYLSLEFLMGRTLDNALLNLGLKENYRKAATTLGFEDFEELVESERDAALGNGGLGRLAACYIDSGTTCELPLWGYGLRYHYGMFWQQISTDGSQVEAPDPWLNHANPWEVHRPDVTYLIRFYGHAERYGDKKAIWSGGQEVLAVAYDVPIPGSYTRNTNNLRLWDAKPKRGFDLNSFNAGDYEKAVESSNSAEALTRVLYPNDNHMVGKELRLKQQYFWVAASLADIIRRFKQLDEPWAKFPEYVAVQLNDTHPTIAVPELMRIFVDEEDIPWNEAWEITQKVFCYTNHTVLPEALEKWAVPLFQHLLPRHLQIIFDLNLYDRRSTRGCVHLLTTSNVHVENSYKVLAMANLAVIGSHKVNGVAELHSELVKTTILKDFVDFYPDKFGNVTNGITPRRWLDQCNPGLSALITETLGGEKSEWLKDLKKLQGLLAHAKDPVFQKKWADVKTQNKERLAHFIEQTLGVKLNTSALFDIQVKRIHEYKRQSMNILGVIHRYLTIKALSAEERKKIVPRVVLFGGKAAPGYYMAKLVIRLINNVAKVINADPDVQDILTVLFVPDYSVSLAELLIPASDISEHISTAGTEASGTSNMKFCLNGGLLLGTVDGANIEIAEEVGEENVFFFGHLTPNGTLPTLSELPLEVFSAWISSAVEDLRHNHQYRPVPLQERCPALAVVFDVIAQGRFGDGHIYEPFLNTIRTGDYYLVSDDFDSYVEAQRMVDEAYQDKAAWAEKSITTTARMGKFSSDRAIMNYADEYWSIEPLKLE
ncbi:glycosyltransferase family 35 protein [Tulasnella calospora MUT 4182]|uniref:Alpha-1,4 glucan phosphorylase n=1 Tax=Tulasnella calospora MUT 4182 TaxID=1051891 RepID=A0A0C3QKC9_9AGAM|nr:glycosyltransferase family 35 protein [Tulasnella calospora MUT 4182]